MSGQSGMDNTKSPQEVWSDNLDYNLTLNSGKNFWKTDTEKQISDLTRSSPMDRTRWTIVRVQSLPLAPIKLMFEAARFLLLVALRCNGWILLFSDKQSYQLWIKFLKYFCFDNEIPRFERIGWIHWSCKLLPEGSCQKFRQFCNWL